MEARAEIVPVHNYMARPGRKGESLFPNSPYMRLVGAGYFVIITSLI
jgi:hypothetical protein